MPDISLAPVPPAEAIRYFRGKGLATSFAWADMWQEEHARAFTVAKAMRASVLQDIRDQVDAALADGTTFQAFLAALRPKLAAQGWWGRAAMTDPLTGETAERQLGSPRRLRTIFDVNLRTAHAAGYWERIEQTADALQYLRYQTAGDEAVRPEHQAWDGVTLAVDDPWWDEHYPPCDWGCRCTVVQVSQGELDRDGRGRVEPVRFPARSWTNPRTGEVVRVEAGIGPGWGYNVGRAYLERDTPSPMGPPDEGEAGAAARPRTGERSDRDGFLAGFGASGGRTVIWADKTGEGLVIGPGLFRDSVGRPRRGPDVDLALVGQALREPEEVWRAWRRGPAQTGNGGASLLVRRYIAGQTVVDWCAQGWWAGAVSRRRLDALRSGGGQVRAA